MNIATLGVQIDPHGAIAAAAQIQAAMTQVVNAAKSMTAAIKEGNKTPVGPPAAEQAAQLSWWQKMRQALSNWLSGTKDAGNATQKMSQQSRDAMAAMTGSGNSLISMFQKMATVIAGISFVAMLVGLAKMGVAFDSLIEDSITGIAAVQRTFNPGIYQNFEMAVTASAEAVELLKVKAKESPATFEALVGAFQATAGAAGKANLSMREHVNLIVMMSQALKGLGIADQQIITESRALLTGNINQNSDAAKMLGITPEDISRATAAGELADFLTKKLSAFSEAGKVASTNLSTSFSNIKDNFQQLAGEVSKPLFEQLRQSAIDFLKVFEGDAGKTALKGLATDLASFASAAASMLGFLVTHAGVILTAAKYLTIFWVALKAIQLAEFISGMLASTVAITTQTTALEANAIAATRAGTAKRMLAGIAVAGAFAAGGGTGTALGAGVGSFFGPWGTIAGAAVGLIYDKMTEGAKRLNAEVAAGIAAAKEQEAAMQKQIGDASTLITQGRARQAIEAKIAEIRKEIPAALAASDAHPTQFNRMTQQLSDSAETVRLRDLQQQLQAYKSMNTSDAYGAYAKDQASAVDFEKSFKTQIELLRKQLDVATTLEAKEKARLAIEKTISDLQAKGAASPSPAGSVGGMTDAIAGAVAQSQTLLKNIDALAGSGLYAAQAQDEINKRMVVADRELGDIVLLSKAKVENDYKEITFLEDKKRTGELLKTLDTDIKNAKADQLSFVKQIVDKERELKEIEAGRTLAEQGRANRMAALDRTPEIAKLEAQGRTQEAQALQTKMLNDRLAEAQRQAAQVQAEQAAALSRAGLKNVPSNLSNSDFGPGGQYNLETSANGMLKNSEAVAVIVPASKAIANATAAIADAMKAVADNSKRILDQVPTDKTTMMGLQQNLQGMRSSYDNGGMSMVEYQRRTDAARDQAAGELSNPGQYKAELGAYRAMSAEKVKISQETDAKITAGGATMSEALTRGFQKAQEGFGNMGTQMVKVAQGISTSISDGIGNALFEIASGTKSAKDAFRDMAIAILNDIAKMIIKMLVELAIAQALSALGYGGGGSVSGATRPSVVAVPTGGNATTGYNYASGGPIYGGRGGVDDIPAMLTAGEYVIKKSSVEKYGTAYLDMINSGKVAKHAEGGSVAAMQARSLSGVAGARGSGVAGGAPNITVTVDARGDGSRDPASEKERADKITRDLKKAMDVWAADARRPGGVLSDNK